MTKEATLDDLKALAKRRKALKRDLLEEYQEKLREKTRILDEERLRLVAMAVQQEVSVRQIGLACGTKDWRTAKALVEQAFLREGDEFFEAPSEFSARGVLITPEDLEVTVALWRGFSGTVRFTKFEGEWMVTGDDEISLAVERALFGDEPDEELKRAVALSD